MKEPNSCWKKKSTFFELEYWKYLVLCQNLDVMHIEKNVCHSLLGTLFNILGKLKDVIGTRLDLIELSVRKKLAPNVGEKRTYLPPACFMLTKEKKRTLCQYLFNVKVLNRYSSNITVLVNMKKLKLMGLKSHDCHTLIQRLLPATI